VFAFLYVKEISKKFAKKYPFLLFSESTDVSIFVEIQGYYLEKMPGYPNFSLWIPMALTKIYFFGVVLTRRKTLCI